MTRFFSTGVPARRAIAAAAVLVAVGTVRAETPVEHGRYLATIAACAGCHTPRTPGAAPFAGGNEVGSGPRAAVSPNITPDRDTGIGTWSRADIVTALHEGRRPDGSRIGPPMPQHAYARLTDADAEAIAAYLASLPPMRNVVARSPRVAASGKPQELPPPTPRTDTPRGRYLFEAVAHCAECHAGPGEPATGAEPKSFGGPHGRVVAPALTPGFVAAFSDEALVQVITAGLRPDGTRLVGPMPVGAYARLTPADRAALIGYLRDPGR